MTGGSAPDLIRIGRVGKPHGVKGGFYVDGAIDPAALRPGLRLCIGEHAFTVVSRGGADARPLLLLAEIADRDVAVSLRGEAIRAARTDLTPLAAGEWYAADLEGMTVVDAAGEALGAVARLRNLPSVDVLEVVRDGDGAALQVPMVADAIVSIDVATRTIEVDTRFLGLDGPV